jgi:hypothetical protein
LTYEFSEAAFVALNFLPRHIETMLNFMGGPTNQFAIEIGIGVSLRAKEKD